MTCFRTARSLISRNMSAAPPPLTLMLSHYWGGLPPSQGSADASHKNEFPGDYAATGSRRFPARRVATALRDCPYRPPPSSGLWLDRNSCLRLRHAQSVLP